ncbi:hypothetical protein [Undibacterium sp. WLX3042]
MILSKQLNFRLNEEEWQALSERAKQSNRKPGELARMNTTTTATC